VDRRALGALVFSEPAARERLNALLHPAMLDRLHAVIAGFRAQPTAPMLVVEGALLAQLATQGWFDRVVVVAAPAALRAQRLREAQRLTPDAAEALIRLHEQMGVGREPADCTIVNDGDRAALEAQARGLVARTHRRRIAGSPAREPWPDNQRYTNQHPAVEALRGLLHGVRLIVERHRRYVKPAARQRAGGSSYAGRADDWEDPA